MRQETINIYTIEDHPNKEQCFDWIRNNWHYLGQHYVEDMVESLKALADAVNGKLDYSISIVPDRSEFVKITDYDTSKLKALVKIKDDMPLTGMCCDFNIIEGLACDELESHILHTIHNEGEYIYSDEGLKEMCEANEYEFNEDGSIR